VGASRKGGYSTATAWLSLNRRGLRAVEFLSPLEVFHYIFFKILGGAHRLLIVSDRKAFKIHSNGFKQFWKSLAGILNMVKPPAIGDYHVPAWGNLRKNICDATPDGHGLLI